jgi:AAA15 family ATPase/GTPase
MFPACSQGHVLMLTAIRFRVQNFRNIDDSDCIDLELINAFVGRNESGKNSAFESVA